MRDRVLLVLYATAVVWATSVHRPWVLGVMLAATLVLSGKGWWSLLRRSLLAVVLFASVVLLAYTGLSLYQGTFQGGYIVLVALRVSTLACMTGLVAERVNLFKAFGFSRGMLYVITLATSQILTMRRTIREFKEALKSRTLKRPKASDLYRHGAATAAYFINKSASNAAEITQAMKSRGFFDDQG